jgi:DNA helicase II / ATP-dependent DNA helicase PcrA
MSELNAEQLAVVNSDAPRICCVAGPGSGKTHMMCARISRLIKDGADPRTIIIITYTNAAADEIKKRVGNDVRFGFIGTLHSFLLRLLTAQGHLVGLPKSLSVLDDDAKEGIIESIIGELGAKTTVKKVLPLLKNCDLITMSPHAHLKSFSKSELCAIEYHARLRKSGLLDFDTVLFWGEKLILVLDGWFYKYVFWDESQDGSDEDFRILEAMPCQHKFIVGDSDQSIFGFRGAKVDNFVKLAVDGMGDVVWEQHRLEINYRCKSRICEVAQRLIEHNSGRVPKQTRAHETGGTVVIESFKSPGEELAFVANELSRSRNRTGMEPAELDDLRETAVLCRTNRLSDAFSAYLEGLGIPVAKKKPVTVPGDWRAARLLLTVMANPFNDLAVHQFLVAAKGKPAADVLRRDAAVNMVSLYQHAMNDGIGGDVSAGLAAHGISHESRERIHDACRQLPEGWTIPELIMFLNSGEADAQQIGDGVFVGTSHSSKGKEWEQVFVCGVEDDQYPGRDAIPESRRLLYVAIMRAKQRVVICHCAARPQNRGAAKPGPMEPKLPSRFLKELAGE